MNTRIKICGITRPQDALTATHLGADALGLVFFNGSKRCITIEQARNITAVIPPFISVVGLFVNENADSIQQILTHIPIEILQFHGDESPEFCRQFHRPYLKAIRVRSHEDIIHATQHYPDARGILLDAHIEGTYGGTGQPFDWSLLPTQWDNNWILAGGLNPHNITQALITTGATAVDVSSGVESAAGIKNTEKIESFINAIRQANATR